MARRYMFVDEAGNFDFSPKGSTFLILTSVTLDGYAAGDELLELRRSLAWDGVQLTDSFHATEEAQAVRDRVFDVLSRHESRVDATIFEKRKTKPHLQSEDTFYPFAWFYHMRHVAPHVANAEDELLVVGVLRNKEETTSLCRGRGQCYETDCQMRRSAHNVLGGGNRSMPANCGLLLMGDSTEVGIG